MLSSRISKEYLGIGSSWVGAEPEVVVSWFMVDFVSYVKEVRELG